MRRWVLLGYVAGMVSCGPGLTHHLAPDAAPDGERSGMPDAPDAAMIDAAIDAAIDAPRDAAIDAPADAAIDAHPDAAIDAHPDAATDAAIDAPPPPPIDAAIDAPPPDAAVAHDAGVSVDAPPDGPQLACTLASLSLTAATLSGCDDPGTLDGARTLARFANPVNVLVAPSGITYVADFDSNRLRAVDATGTVTTLVENTAMHRPFGLALSNDGTALYVESDDDDAGNHSETTGTIWRVTLATGAITVIADELGRPRGLAVLPDGDLVLSDEVHHVVSLLDPSTGDIEGLAGGVDQPGHVNAGGGAARFDTPYAVAVLPDGDLAVADQDNHLIRRVTLDGLVSDLAGCGVAGDSDGSYATASFDQPRGLALGPDGSLYVSDAGNRHIRRIANGMVTTIAGSSIGYLDSDDPLAAQFYGVEGLFVSPDGTRLVIADGNQGDGTLHDHVRVVDLTRIAPDTVTSVVRALAAPLRRL